MNRFPSVLRRIVKWYPHYNLASLHERKERLLRFIHEHSGTNTDALALAEWLRRVEKPDEAIDVLKNYMETEDAQITLQRYHVAAEVARILMQEKRFDEALAYAELAGSCYSATGLRILAECHEVMGNFTKADETFSRLAGNYSNYPDETVRWAEFCQRVDSPNWERAKAAVITRAKQDQANKKTLTRYTFFYRLADIPFLSGMPDLLDCFRQERYDRYGWPVLMDAISSGDKKRTEEIFTYLLRERRFQDQTPNDLWVTFDSLSLVNLLWLDWQSGNPGNIDENAIHYVLWLSRNSNLISGGIQHVLCPLAMYYDSLGNQEKAGYYARQSLASTEATGFPFRNVALGILKKCHPGFSLNDYAELMKTEKVLIPPAPVFDSMADLMCTMILQNYDALPSGVLLEESPEQMPPGMLPLFNMPHSYWKVKYLKFRDQTWNENETALKCIMNDGYFTFRGIGCDLDFVSFAEKIPGEPTMIKLTNAICNAAFRGLILYNGDDQPIKICLNLKDNGNYPKTLDTANDSNCVIMELEKMDVGL